MRFTLDWRFEGPAALFTVALDKGYFKAEGLDVTIDPAAGSREPISRVASGTYDMGFGDINSLVRFRDENPTVDIKAVMIVYDRPPFAIVGRKSRGITKDVASLQGQELRRARRPTAPMRNGRSSRPSTRSTTPAMRFENVGFPVREPMLAQGEVDAVFGFSMSSFINLKSRGVPADDIVVLLMSRLRRRALRQRDHGLAEVRGREAGGGEGLSARAAKGVQRHGRRPLRRGRLR